MNRIISGLRAGVDSAVRRRVRELWYPVPEGAKPGGAGFSSPARIPVLLEAASRLYEKGLRIDQVGRLEKRTRLSAPVISVGNLSVGGTGKTPLTILLCRLLVDAGIRPAVLTRGYGKSGGSTGLVPRSADPAGAAALFGDEPVMMSEYLPEVQIRVGADRAASGAAALSRGGVDVLVLDDGFQHLALHRDLDIVLLDSRSPFGNGHLLPAGPLREPVAHLARADAFVLTHAEKSSTAAALKEELDRLFPGKPVFSCRHVLRGIRPGRCDATIPVEALAGIKAAAFAGIAGPDGFFSGLAGAGIRLCASMGFPDHHRYTEGDFSSIFARASNCGANLIVTTAKDAVRIPSRLRDAFASAEIDMDFSADYEKFRRFITDRIDPADRMGPGPAG